MLVELLAAASVAAAPAQHWLAYSKTAMSITGDVFFTPSRIAFQDRKWLAIRRESRGAYDTYRILSHTNPILLNGNTLCGGMSSPSFVTVRYGRNTSSTETTVETAFYTGPNAPRRWDDPTNLCATFTYAMKPLQTAVAMLAD